MAKSSRNSSFLRGGGGGVVLSLMLVTITSFHHAHFIVNGFVLSSLSSTTRLVDRRSTLFSATASVSEQPATEQQQQQHQVTSTTTTTTTTTSSRFGFWGIDRSVEEIQRHLVCSKLNIGHDDVQVLSASPPVVVIHNLLTADQCHAIMEGAIHQQMQRSTAYIVHADDDDDDENKEKEKDESKASGTSSSSTDQTSTSNIRTSSTVWLRDDDDDDDEEQDSLNNNNNNNKQHPTTTATVGSMSLLSHTLRQVADYASHMSGMPPHYMENLQVVRYLPGQEFQVHTDHLNSFNDLERGGGRLATCLFYLQSPTVGGATYFPDVNVHVMPRRGSALFFWNTMERPGSVNYQDDMFLHADERVRHAGLPVVEGEKWICNRWIHPMDYGAGVRGL